MSSLPSDLPKLPKWPFFLFDAVLLATAFAIAWTHPRQLEGMPLYAVSACVMLAAIMCAVPLLFDYTRSQDEALDERQRALESLSRTVAASAEQVSVAAKGLVEIIENTNRCLKHAEQLPQKVQEKVADFQARIDSARDDEIEDLERELAALRGSESEKLENASEKTRKTAQELAKLETALAKQIVGASETISRLEKVSEQASGRMAELIGESIARMEAELTKVQGAVGLSLSHEQERMIEQMQARLNASLEHLEAKSVKAAALIEEKIKALDAVSLKIGADPMQAPQVVTPSAMDSGLENDAPGEVVRQQPPAKRSRRSKKEEELGAAEAVESPKPTENEEPEKAPVSEEPLKVQESPVTVVEQTPVAPVNEVEPAAEEKTLTEQEDPAPTPLREEPNPVAVTVVEASTVEADGSSEEQATPEQNEFSQISPDEAAPVASVSADGATRLIVTAYIGIGNRLYIRGEGPGLSWEKGLPLQFVSIGKWRWESADVTAPVRIKLLKNDQVECAALGELLLSPGHQAEVSANF